MIKLVKKNLKTETVSNFVFDLNDYIFISSLEIDKIFLNIFLA